MPDNVIKWLKNRLLRYLIDVHVFDEGQYLTAYFRELKVDLLLLAEQVLLNGLIGYVCLFGIITLFPATAGIIKLGTSKFGVFIAFLLTGIIVTVIRNMYTEIRFGGVR